MLLESIWKFATLLCMNYTSGIWLISSSYFRKDLYLNRQLKQSMHTIISVVIQALIFAKRYGLLAKTADPAKVSEKRGSFI